MQTLKGTLKSVTYVDTSTMGKEHRRKMEDSQGRAQS